LTCIVGIKTDKGVIIGGDSAGSSGHFTHGRRDPKVFRTGEFLMGFTTSFRMGQLLLCSLSVSEQTSKQDDYTFMVTTFVDAVRDCLKDGGYATKESEGEHGGTFLVGYKGELYFIDSDYQVGKCIDDYTAIGCGEEIAHGALYILDNDIGFNGDPKQCVEVALEAAAKFSGYVSAPFLIMDESGKTLR